MLKIFKFRFSADKIKNLIKQSIKVDLIDIQDDSSGHSIGKNSHFRIYVVSDDFD